MFQWHYNNEMLNRHLPSSDLRHVFGVGPNANGAPDLILLDEVHLYAGSYGAQVAYLLRRWWTASRRQSIFVGVSGGRHVSSQASLLCGSDVPGVFVDVELRIHSTTASSSEASCFACVTC